MEIANPTNDDKKDIKAIMNARYALQSSTLNSLPKTVKTNKTESPPSSPQTPLTPPSQEKRKLNPQKPPSKTPPPTNNNNSQNPHHELHNINSPLHHHAVVEERKRNKVEIFQQVMLFLMWVRWGGREIIGVGGEERGKGRGGEKRRSKTRKLRLDQRRD